MKKAIALLILTVLLLTANVQATETPRKLIASWYSIQSLKNEGTWKHSKGVMANGKHFSDSGLTAACRLYPLGSRVMVTNVANGKTVCVTITDRIGKRFAKTRIDLSKGAMEALGGKQALIQGLLQVEVEEL
jgi:rare lipoprotein A